MSSKSSFGVKEFLALARSYGFTVTIRDGIVRVDKRFTAGDAGEYGDAESKARALLAHLPITRPGSTWGTTSDGVGGYVGLKNGEMTLSRSGVDKRWCRQVSTEMGRRI